jgi:hypothetical protein
MQSCKKGRTSWASSWLLEAMADDWSAACSRASCSTGAAVVQDEPPLGVHLRARNAVGMVGTGGTPSAGTVGNIQVLRELADDDGCNGSRRE